MPAQPLPNGLSINGHLILSTNQTTDLYHVYDTMNQEGSRVELYEFCPQALAIRDEETYKLRYADDPEVYNQLLAYKSQFDQQIAPLAAGEISDFGTIFYIKSNRITPVIAPTPASIHAPNPFNVGNGGAVVANRAPIPSLRSSSKKKSGATGTILTLVGLGAIGYFGYAYVNKTQDTPTTSDQEQTEFLDSKKSDKITQKVEKVKPVEEIVVPTDDTLADMADTSISDTPSIQEDKQEVEPEPAPIVEEKDTVASAESQLNLEDFNKPKTAGKNKKQFRTDPSAVSTYIKQFCQPMTNKQWNEQYSNVEQNWFNTTDEVYASRYITTFGPLGIRAIQLDVTWNDFSNFKSLYPKELFDNEGNMCINMYKVVNVIPGSPAEKHIESGDLILAIDNTPLISASAYKPKYGPYNLQDRRGLDLHAGILIDEAEGRGTISLTVLKPQNLSKCPPLKDIWKEHQRIEKIGDDTEISIKLKPNEVVRLTVDDGGNGRGSDGFSWVNTSLQGKKGNIELNSGTEIQYNVGHGPKTYDKETKTWQSHAPSVLAFKAPAQGEWVFKAKGVKGSAASVGLTVDTSTFSGIPDSVLKQCKNVSFKIPRIGSYAEGFPKNCPKAKAVVTMLSEWLLAQQKPDGSWDRPGGYCDNNYDTGMAGLALMATGDKKYNEAIKKAAHYVAFGGAHSWWAVPQASAGTFLCEYYLRFKDETVLPAIFNGVRRMKSEVLYGDFVTGHGIHPGYAGTGVSIGGSSMTLFLALASKTPARVEDGVLEKMLDKAQELCPTGFGPYGRKTESFSFEPDRQAGGTYSGRHGPYYLAARIANGPALFVKNATIMYSEGPPGGADCGHSSETLSVMSALPCYWVASPESYYKNMESLRWKLTLMRPFDSGLLYNPNRTELMTADGVLGVYIRTASWIIGLCADRQNLAITGKPEHMSKKFRNVPAVLDTESRFYQTTLRNWSLASAALGSKSPADLKSAIAEMKKTPVKQGCRYPILDIVKSKSTRIAKEILALTGVDNITKAYCAEMVLGVNVMINLEPRENYKTYGYHFDIQRPFSGKNFGIRDNAQRSANEEKYKMPFKGSIKIEGGEGIVPFDTITWDDSTKFGGDWDSFSKGEIIPEGKISSPKPLTAVIDMQIDDVKISYKRPLTIGAFEVGCGEKQRSVANDRFVWIPGKLIQDHGNWGASFTLPDGTYVSAASQGNQIWVTDESEKNKKPRKWVAPNDCTITKGSQALFKVSSDWHGFECRVGELKLRKQGSASLPYKLSAKGSSNIPTEKLTDKDVLSFEEIPLTGGEPLELNINLNSTELVRAIDMKLFRGYHKIEVEAYKNGKWTPVYWGGVGAAAEGENHEAKAFYQDEDITHATQLHGNGFPKNIRNFIPAQTNKLKIKVHGNGTLKLGELHIYREERDSADKK